MNIISFFSGCGGLDLGFEKAGFNIVWANDNSIKVKETYNFNHKTKIKIKNIVEVLSEELPECDGIIGGPPCQSWSVAGSGKGLEDARGKLFRDYIRLIDTKNPKFFLAENVKGILAKKHDIARNELINSLSKSGEYGYDVFVGLLNSKDFKVPQDRERVFFIGFRKDLKKDFNFSLFQKYVKKEIKKELTKEYGYEKEYLTLRDTILEYTNAIPAKDKNKTNNIKNNNEYGIGDFSYIFMSRNRVRSWDEQSFTIQASSRQAPLHPQAPKMIKVKTNVQKFEEGKEHLYRRLSIREVATIQTFPKDFKFFYENINDAYKMIGNAVPVNLAFYLAREIMKKIKTESNQ
ncbi:MAG: DNA cytosine methyltransferase [Fusobacteriaceae bacterium]